MHKNNINGGVSDDSRARVEQEDCEIYTAHYGTSGGRVPYIRVLCLNSKSYVLAVTDPEEQKAKVVATCDFRIGRLGPFFMTTAEHIGHFGLCCHLLEKGVKGDYRDYLEKIERGLKKTANEESGRATILFSVQLTEDTLDDWEIDWGKFAKKTGEPK